MAKYSLKFRQKVADKYLQEKISYGQLAQKYHISIRTRIKEWIATYRKPFNVRINIKYTLFSTYLYLQKNFHRLFLERK